MDKVVVTLLRQIHNTKGDVFHAMKKSDLGFNGFGEAYFSKIKQNDIKGWKQHSRMTLNLVVPIGEIQFVVYEDESKTFFTINLSQQNYQRLTVKPGAWMAFKGIGKENMLLNLASIEHDPSEAINVALEDIHYDW